MIPERVNANPHYNQHQEELKHNGRVLLMSGTFLSQPHSKSSTSFPSSPSLIQCCLYAVMGHTSNHYQSVTSHASPFWESGWNCSESHNEQHESVVNISLNCFVWIKLWLIVKAFSKFCRAYLQRGVLFPKFPFLPLPLLSQADS